MRSQFVAFGLTIVAFLLVTATALDSLFAQNDLYELDNESRRWIDETLETMPLDEKLGQLVLPSLRSNYTSSDSDVYDELSGLVQQQRVGGSMSLVVDNWCQMFFSIMFILERSLGDPLRRRQCLTGYRPSREYRC